MKKIGNIINEKKPKKEKPLTKKAESALAPLTKKQKGFVKDYVKTGNGTKSVLNNYNVKDETVASSIATENLTKPLIQEAIKAIADRIDEETIVRRHNELLDQKRIDYFTFPKFMEDEEIIDHVESVGIKVITVRESDKGKMAFYAISDSQAVKAGLDMAYKLKGSYAAEKKTVKHEGFSLSALFLGEYDEEE